MAKVTYRGVEYDSAEYNKKVLAEAAQHRNFDLMYRGIKVSKKLTAVQRIKGGVYTPLFLYYN